MGQRTFEPHPVSGEIEVPDDITVRYKRLDSETLRTRLPLPDYDIAVLYVWCAGDQEGGGPGWRVAEVRPLDADVDEEKTWTVSVGEANDLLQETILQEALAAAEGEVKRENPQTTEYEEQDDDDDDYWAQYDDNMGRTPTHQEPPASNNLHSATSTKPGDPESSYFSRYGDVQPALDNDDPSVDQTEIGQSSLGGNAVADLLRRQIESIGQRQDHSSTFSETERPIDADYSVLPLSHPRPETASSAGSDAVSKLEQSAENQSTSEMAVRNHISTSIKSLFRLAKSSGISREEFASDVQRELELLELVDSDDE